MKIFEGVVVLRFSVIQGFDRVYHPTQNHRPTLPEPSFSRSTLPRPSLLRPSLPAPDTGERALP